MLAKERIEGNGFLFEAVHFVGSDYSVAWRFDERGGARSNWEGAARSASNDASPKRGPASPKLCLVSQLLCSGTL